MPRGCLFTCLERRHDGPVVESLGTLLKARERWQEPSWIGRLELYDKKQGKEELCRISQFIISWIKPAAPVKSDDITSCLARTAVVRRLVHYEGEGLEPYSPADQKRRCLTVFSIA